MSRQMLFVPVAAVLALVSLCSFTEADDAQKASANQNATNRANGTQADRSGTAGHWKNPDHCFATCVALGNQEEVALGQFASQKAKNPEVKKFAEMLVEDHTEYLGKLKNFAPEASSQGYLRGEGGTGPKAGARNREATNQREGATQETATKTGAGVRTGDQSADGLKPSEIEREVAEECLNSAMAKLNEKAGTADFDKCFIGQQIAKHMGMKDKLAVYQRHASSELAQVFAAGQKKTEEHLAKAEDLMKMLEGEKGKSTSPKTGSDSN